jgi:hypothetical protein
MDVERVGMALWQGWISVLPKHKVEGASSPQLVENIGSFGRHGRQEPVINRHVAAADLDVAN